MIVFQQTRLHALFFLLLLLFPAIEIFSQQSINNLAGGYKAGDATVTPVMTAPCMGLRNEPSEDLKWQPLVIKKQVEHENPSANEAVT
jgi:hypothetical protein